jgi:hypothetical protein
LRRRWDAEQLCGERDGHSLRCRLVIRDVDGAIGALAEGGEIVASRSMVEASGSSLPTSNAHTATLKGISEPVPVVTIDWR